MQKLKLVIKELLRITKRQEEQIAFLENRVAVLEAKLARYKHPKSSSNSSTPPSQDPFRLKRTTSLRGQTSGD